MKKQIDANLITSVLLVQQKGGRGEVRYTCYMGYVQDNLIETEKYKTYHIVRFFGLAGEFVPMTYFQLRIQSSVYMMSQKRLELLTRAP